MWPQHKGKNEQTKSTREGSEAAVYVLCCFSPAWLSVAQWTAARQAPLLTGLSRKEHWRRLPCPPPGDLPKSAIKPAPLTSPVLAGVTYHLCGTTWEAHDCWLACKYKLNHFEIHFTTIRRAELRRLILSNFGNQKPYSLWRIYHVLVYFWLNQ